jgi:hypothetical protein
MWPQSVVRLLLESGANIGVKNIYDEVPIAQILPGLENFSILYMGDELGN